MGAILIVKILSWIVAIVFGVIVLALTEDKLRDVNYTNAAVVNKCVFGFKIDTLDSKEQACDLALAVGVIGMVIGIVGLVLEIVVEKGGAIMIVIKKFIFLGLMIVAIVAAILWIATFIYLIYVWEEETDRSKTVGNGKVELKDEDTNSAGAVLAFSFLSAAVQVLLVILEKIDHGNALSVPLP